MLTHNAPNLFWKFIKDEALLKNEISLKEYMGSDWDLKRKLKICWTQ